MKQILLVPGIILMLTLSGCAVSPSLPGNNIAGIGSSGILANQNAAIINTPRNETYLAAGSPNSTGSIVPLNDEGAVVDLPDSSAQKRASSSLQSGPPAAGDEDTATQEGDQASSAQERHRRELINRGDLREGQPIPVE